MGGFFEYIQGKDTRQRTKKTFLADDVSVNHPKGFSDIRLLLESLKSNEGFIVDFENTETSLAQRMLDFLSGGVYIIGGKMEHIKEKMYIILPKDKAKNQKEKGKK